MENLPAVVGFGAATAALVEGVEEVRRLGHDLNTDMWQQRSLADAISAEAERVERVPRERLIPCTNCGLAPMSREVALAKLDALAKGAALARQRYGA